MKKLLLLLLPALLLPACKDPEDETLTNAKNLAGTYECTRKGTIYYEDSTGNHSRIESPINYTYNATITYLGDNRVQLDMGGIFTGWVGEYNGTKNAIVFDTYTASDSSELLSTKFNIDIDGFYYSGYYGHTKISLNETYSGTAQGPNVTYTIRGTGTTDLSR